jgi:regulator of replication initiation timing
MNFLKWLFGNYTPMGVMQSRLDLAHDRITQLAAQNAVLTAENAALKAQLKDQQLRLDQREEEVKKLAKLVTELEKRPAVWAKVL